MSRELSADMQAALRATVLRPLYFFELEFASTTVRLVTGNRDWAWNAHTWLANNKILSIDETLHDATDIRSPGAKFTFGGADTDMLALALADTEQSRIGQIWMGLVNSSDQLIADPAQIFKGNFDHCEIRDDGTRSSIEFYYEHEFITLSRTKELRYTKFCQESLFAGDLGFDYAPAAEDWSGFWGKVQRVLVQRKRKSGRK